MATETSELSQVSGNAAELRADGVKALLPLLDEATERGFAELMAKVAPLVQGKRLHNVIDLLSLVSDGVDMFDDATVQKLMKAYDETIGAAWAMGNAARYAAAQTSTSAPPSLFGLLRIAGQDDVRRGLNFALLFLSVLGRQMRQDQQE
jgi:uncharacterized protein YjgD (DUF1641 family)